MRKIKFRGKQLDNGEWAYGFYYEWRGKITSITRARIHEITMDGNLKIEDKQYKVDPKTVGQFIGRTDSKSVEIFEGDIIEANLSDHNLPTKGCIVYNETFGAFANKNDAGETLLHNMCLNTFEVVDNIHDNPAWLK